jgi:excisionase family DNA binding protein
VHIGHSAGVRKPQLDTTTLNFLTSAPFSRGSGDGMAPKIDTEKLVTVTQAAKLLKITPAAIHKAIKRGRLPYIKLGGVFLIQRADLISSH